MKQQYEKPYAVISVLSAGEVNQESSCPFESCPEIGCGCEGGNF